MRRRIASGACASAVILFALLSATAASADTAGDNYRATPTESGADVRASTQLGGPGAATRSSGGTVTCHYIEVGETLIPTGYGGYDGLLGGFNVVIELRENIWYVAACSSSGGDLSTRLFRYTPGGPAPIDARALAQQAVDTLTVAYPDPSTSPSIEHDHLVGLATWMWIDPQGFEPVTATASIPGLSVTATATPTKVVWDMGDDTDSVICDDAGTAYDTDRRPEDQDTDCSHVYQWHGDYTATATTTWEITWSATNGDGGTLPTIDRTTSFDLHVVERQAVVTG